MARAPRIPRACWSSPVSPPSPSSSFTSRQATRSSCSRAMAATRRITTRCGRDTASTGRCSSSSCATSRAVPVRRFRAFVHVPATGHAGAARSSAGDGAARRNGVAAVGHLGFGAVPDLRYLARSTRSGRRLSAPLHRSHSRPRSTGPGRSSFSIAAVKLGVFPAGGIDLSAGVARTDSLAPPIVLWHLLLPAFTLSLPFAAVVAASQSRQHARDTA